MAEWQNFDNQLRTKSLAKKNEAEIWQSITNGARKVMRNYSTSFYLVSRFLPLDKRRKVEAIYAAVRYPDEIVDTFNISADEKYRMLDNWSEWYDKSLKYESVGESLLNSAPCFISSFVHVVKETGIPHNYYRAFLDAMRKDIGQTFYNNINDLIDSYIYGSAIVVGYFLTYVYKSKTPQDFDKALLASKNLGIALQLTNFMRDISDDQDRKRLYIPLDMLQQTGITLEKIKTQESLPNLKRIVNQILEIADEYYALANSNLDMFADDCQTAIRACINVYRELNNMIRISNDSLTRRLSVPLLQKFKVLPTSKYWRIPSAYLFGT